MRLESLIFMILSAACVAVEPAAATAPQREQSSRKVILVVFGGGTRASESIDDPRHRWIPHLWSEMAPRGTLFTNVRVQGKIVHPACTAGMLTGHEEYGDDDWSRPVEHPTIFEIYRKSRQTPDTSAWAFVYASILAKAGWSRAPGYGADFAPNVVEPPTISREAAENIQRRLEEGIASGSLKTQIAFARESAFNAKLTSSLEEGGLRSKPARELVVEQFQRWQGGQGTSSHDAFLAEAAMACMRQLAPDVIVVAFGEIDCAHYGSWSRYTDAMRRTDELAWRIWRTAEELPAYRGQTLLLVAPDHGRELETTHQRDAGATPAISVSCAAPGGSGFLGHSDFYTRQGEDEGCRRVWLVAVGPGVTAGGLVRGPVPSTAVAATALEYLGLRASAGAAASLWPHMKAGCSSTGPER